MNSIAPMSTPRVGWPTSRAFGAAESSRATTIFCWLPPEKPPQRRSGSGGRDVEALHELRAPLPDGGKGEEDPVARLRPALVAEDGRLGRGEREHQAALLAVLRNVGEAHVAEQGGFGRGGRRERPPRERDPPGLGRLDPGQYVEELRLPVPGHPGHAEDLARPELEANVGEAGRAPLVGVAQALDGEDRRPRRPRLAADREQHIAAHHQPGELLLARLARVAMGHHLAAAHHEHGVGRGHDLAQLVGDEEDGHAVALEDLEDLEQPVGFLGGQHPGRFVQDQNAGAAEQGLQDLDPLLKSDRKIPDERVGIDLESVGGADLVHPRAGRLLAAGEQGAALAPEHHVLEHRHGRHQHEVLVHHADAVLDGVRRAGHPDRLPVDPDLAAVGGVEPVEDGHEGGFAGAVLADDPGDRSTVDREVDVAVGLDGPEALVDLPELDRRRGERPAGGRGCLYPFSASLQGSEPCSLWEGTWSRARRPACQREVVTSGTTGRTRSCGPRSCRR